jgi:hypothetical protein
MGARHFVTLPDGAARCGIPEMTSMALGIRHAPLTRALARHGGCRSIEEERGDNVRALKNMNPGG